ncbi:basic helix-loop-helix (bHLH) DNA-binding superfamily protein [Rhynchospora pubera]|uniref:Basic helix-loop-helix (BHLH) DNA-binding superfamily protein n=1 Tax=Rhynchospora pubera TaxID=906938 RepID=A0AAV8H043_9POAL|nr:basic helix-loop-helix (bHLH) DNA-binding superfamily protein [Rhynchospora pubera]
MEGGFLDHLFEQSSYHIPISTGETSPVDLLSMLESLEDGSVVTRPLYQFGQSSIIIGSCGNKHHESTLPMPVDVSSDKKIKVDKKRKLVAQDAPHKTSHITVERNRRKQMNEHLSVLRSLMPCFYVKRGDQASIIGGVVDYIKELQQVLESLEAKKQRKLCSEVLSPIQASSPHLLHSPKPPFSPKLGLPISPRTPLPESPYKCNALQSQILDKIVLPTQAMSSTTALAMADVTVEFAGPNVLLKTISRHIPGQMLKIVAALDNLSLEILQANISIVNGTMLNSFTIKV